MRLFVAAACLATVSAFIVDDQNLQRVKRADDEEDEGCEEGFVESVPGFCVKPTDTDTIAALKDLQEAGEDEEDEDESAVLERSRKFQLGGQQNDVFNKDGVNQDMVRSKRRSQRITMLYSKVNNGFTLNGQPIRPKKFIQMMNSYACHCWTRTNSEQIGYKGKPIDPIDESCKKLSQCHSCLEWQGFAQPAKGCDPVTQKYRASLFKNEDGQLQIECKNTLNHKKTNHGDCKRDLCECDKQFAIDVAENWDSWSMENWNLQNKNVFEQACKTSGGARAISMTPPDACCGTWPRVKPYSSIFNACENGQIVQIGNKLL